MQHTFSRRRYSLLAVFFVLPSVVFSQVTIKEKVYINPKSPARATVDAQDFVIENVLTVPYRASVSVQSGMYSPSVCPRDLKLGDQVVLQNLQYAPFTYLGDFEARGTALVYACSKGLRYIQTRNILSDGGSQALLRVPVWLFL